MGKQHGKKHLIEEKQVKKLKHNSSASEVSQGN